jgi:UDP-N-acetylglucosamine--N-acetylmuramyl-(pentapeptide) pyrophosphoryl-undecaprenol N-acetylglucosamine transferase
MIAAAGTGGHIYPGLAVADVFEKNGFNVFWLGTSYGMENNLLDLKKIKLFHLSIEGIRGKGLLTWFKLPLILLHSFFQALNAIRKTKPMAVILMGGYISMPVALAAKTLKIKVIIHEQNAIPGFTNRALSKIATKVFCAFPGSLKNATVIGNPIRTEINNVLKPNKRFINRKGPLRILVIGGSLGATFFNNNLPNLFKLISKVKKISVTHQSGVKNYKSLIKNYGKVNFPLKVVKFVYDIEEKYEWADLVIARSGALTVSELSQAGIASILVPYPFAVDNHQYLNAKILEERGATIIVNQSEGVDKIFKVLKFFDRKKCKKMALNAQHKLEQKPSYEIFKFCQLINK